MKSHKNSLVKQNRLHSCWSASQISKTGCPSQPLFYFYVTFHKLPSQAYHIYQSVSPRMSQSPWSQGQSRGPHKHQRLTRSTPKVLGGSEHKYILCDTVQEYQCHYANAHHMAPPDFLLGSEAYVHMEFFHVTCPSKKLSDKMSGPFEVIVWPGSHSYTLCLPNSMCLVHPVFHVLVLKPHTPTPFLAMSSRLLCPRLSMVRSISRSMCRVPLPNRAVEVT